MSAQAWVSWGNPGLERLFVPVPAAAGLRLVVAFRTYLLPGTIMNVAQYSQNIFRFDFEVWPLFRMLFRFVYRVHYIRIYTRWVSE